MKAKDMDGLQPRLRDVLTSLESSTTGLGDIVTANKAAAQADSTAEDVVTLVSDFNALLAKLRAAGIMSE
jgi:hypothetical protein